MSTYQALINASWQKVMKIQPILRFPQKDYVAIESISGVIPAEIAR